MAAGEADIRSPGGRKPDIRDTDNRYFSRDAQARCNQADYIHFPALPGASTQLRSPGISEVIRNKRAGETFSLNITYDSATPFKVQVELGALLDGNIDIGFIQLGIFLYDNGSAV